ncbi:MFS transporter [Mesorhizobium sp.]|uniref:MFS transporter n=1 Tax=Mesorhizobium sp. TaxID=1871066 RepID=UPI00121D90F1|nr:MFS transporter [Mesorhizobium sp.]TIN08618.1 MAG: MFS transporter [Mesorhizobium sp.]
MGDGSTVRRSANIILITTFLSNAGSYLVIPILAVYLVQTAGLSVAVVGAVYASMAVAQSAGSLLAGPIAHHIGPKAGLAIGLALRVMAFPIFVVSESTVHLSVACMLIWCGSGIYVPIAKSVLSAAIPPGNQRAKYLALRNSVANAGVAVGPIISIGVVRHSSETTLFWSATALFAVCLVSNFWVVLDKLGTRLSLGNYIASLVSLTKMPQAKLLIYTVIVFHALFVLFQLVMPIYGNAKVSATAPQIAYLVNSILVVVVPLAVAGWIQRSRDRLCLFLGLSLVAFSCVTMFFCAGQLGVFVVGVIFISIAEVILIVKIDVIASAVAGSLLSISFGAIGVLGTLGAVVGNQLFSGLLSQTNTQPIFWIISGGIAAVLAFGVLVVKVPRGTQMS